MDNYCYLNGEILPVRDAKISIYDIGVLRGYGIYEGIKTYQKKPFFLKAHLDRFRNSAKAINLKIPIDDIEFANVIDQLVEKNGFTETNIRAILTGGLTYNGIEYDYNNPTFFILAEENSAISEEYYTNGCKLISFEHQRQYPEYKTTNYITGVNLQNIRKEKEALEILYVSNGKIMECATSNFFVFQGDKLITPKKNVLPGITRKVTIDAVKGVFEVEERDLMVAELPDVTEAFLTATYKEVVPVVKIDDKLIGTGKVGEYTKKVMELFHKQTL